MPWSSEEGNKDRNRQGLTSMAQGKSTDNFLTRVTSLSNRYFLLRHGQSYANQQGLIVSIPAHAVGQYGLTFKGQREVEAHVARAKKEGKFSAPSLIVSSPFLRARQSAEIASRILNATIQVDERLRERSFGDFELTTDTNYQAVWTKDQQNPLHTEWGVESLAAVLYRTTSLVEELEQQVSDHSVFLCTHGDVASILVCGFLNAELSGHRELGAMGTGEVCELLLQSRGEKSR